jgi:D-alanyl-lipoteichoic acid acyltransferase DltB (MBOAT superfamily)
MLFNSQEFLFVFLPVTLLGFYLLGPIARQWAILWLILMSLVFYGWWRPVNILIIGPSILINFALSSFLLRLSEKGDQPGLSRLVLLGGILFNILFLGFFKYADFVYGTINDVFGANFVLLHVILPLGISFITFQKIAFLIDVQAGRVKAFTFREYCTFVLFFPQLVAGPIVHYREMMPQFATATCRFDKENFAVGLTLLFFGLFKKGVLADNIAPLVTPIYEHSAAVGHTPFLLSWLAALGFTLQLYFDFSGYTDMAIGLAWMVGLRFPDNFDQPYRATSVIDYWQRWHMSLSRFLVTHVHAPMTLAVMRGRKARGLAVNGPAQRTVGGFATMIAMPLAVTMVLVALWHGATWPFLVFGLLHAAFLIVNHVWRLAQAPALPRPASIALTYLCVLVGAVLFRAATVSDAGAMLAGMAGLHGFNALQFDYPTAIAVLWLLALYAIVWFAPSTRQWMQGGSAGRLGWTLSPQWAFVMGGAATLGLLAAGGTGEFLYFRF